MQYADYQSQLSSIERRRAIAQAMQQAGLQGPQAPGMVSGRYVGSGLLASIAPLLQTALGTFADRKGEKQQKTLNEQQGAEVQTAMEGYSAAADPTSRRAELAKLSGMVASPMDNAKLLIAQAMAQKPTIKPVDPTKFTAESVNKYGQTGNYSDLVPETNAANTKLPASTLQYYEKAVGQGYKGSLMEFAPKWAEITAQYPYSVGQVNNIPTLINRTSAGGAPSPMMQPPPQMPPAGPQQMPPPQAAPTPRQIPLTTLPTQAASAAEMKRSEAAGGALGKAQGEIAGGIQTKGANADVVLGLLDEAAPLLEQATGSMGGRVMDATQAAFGGTNEGSRSIAQLKVIQAGLMTNMPRMEGPQSDRDVELYREAAGQIGDPAIPREIKKAALDTIRNIQQRYSQRAAGAGAPSAVGVPPAGQAPVKVSSPAEAAALPPGTVFMTPDGRLKRR